MTTKQITYFILALIFVFPSYANDNNALDIASWELQTQSGETVPWNDLKGKPLILHFWATWCPYCKKLQPGLDRLYKKYQSQGLQLVAISFREDPGTLPQDVLDDRGHSFQTLVEGDTVAHEIFNVSGTPTTLFIYANGDVLGMTRSSDPDDPRLEKAVQHLLANYEQH